MNSLEDLALLHAHGIRPRWDQDQPTPDDDWVKVLAMFPLFAGVSRRRLRRLVRGATLAEYAPRETILYAGERGDFLYVILGGTAEARSKAAGRALRTGDYFGDIAMIDGGRRSATVVATTELHAMRLPSRSVLELARQHAGIALTMLENRTTQLRRLETYLARAA